MSLFRSRYNRRVRAFVVVGTTDGYVPSSSSVQQTAEMVEPRNLKDANSSRRSPFISMHIVRNDLPPRLKKQRGRRRGSKPQIRWDECVNRGVEGRRRAV
ncbi:hypothetical protein LSAT2_029112 [Lamellibrachia satsuma]|nr:hypothetical protein LSAT2_029112 [Lamellibrachia satsuma]